MGLCVSGLAWAWPGALPAADGSGVTALDPEDGAFRPDWSSKE